MPFSLLGAASARDERLVLVGLAVAVTAVVAGIVPVLRRFRDASEIKAVEPKPQYITHETEDALPLATLASLAGHYNFAVREMASKIVFDRAVHDPAVLHALLWGIAQADYDERLKHLQMLSMVADQNNLHLFHTKMAYTAFVRSLEHCLGTVDADALNDRFVDEYPLRDIAEKMCLMFLGNLAYKFGVDGLLRAGFVARWLARQPWVTDAQVAAAMAGKDGKDGGKDGKNGGNKDGGNKDGGNKDDPAYEARVRYAQRARSFEQYARHRRNRITELCFQLQKYRAGVAALEKAGLLERRPRRAGHGRLLRPFSLLPRALQDGGDGNDGNDGNDRNDDEGDNVENANDHVTAPADLGQTRRQHPRPSQEEQRIRRQHREAMVLNDGTRPLRRGDIIERGGG